jgi:hypothetical protein
MNCKISQARVLAFPNLQNPFKVETNASGYVMGAVLMHTDKMILYHSKMFHGEVSVDVTVVAGGINLHL